MSIKKLLTALLCVTACSPALASMSGEDCVKLVIEDLVIERGEWVVMTEGGQPLIAQVNALWYNDQGVPERTARYYQCKDIQTYRRVYTEQDWGEGVGPWRKHE